MTLTLKPHVFVYSVTKISNLSFCAIDSLSVISRVSLVKVCLHVSIVKLIWESWTWVTMTCRIQEWSFYLMDWRVHTVNSTHWGKKTEGSLGYEIKAALCSGPDLLGRGRLMALFHCMVRYGSVTARYGTVRLSSGRFCCFHCSLVPL